VTSQPDISTKLVVSWCEYFNSLPEDVDVPSIVEAAPPKHKCNIPFILAAVLCDPRALAHADFSLRGNRQIALTAVRQQGTSLQSLSETMRCDKEVVLASVSQDGEALQFAHERLKSDRMVVLAAIQQIPSAIRFASDKLKADRHIALAAVSKDGALVRYLDETLKKDRMVVLTAVQQDAASMRYVGHHFKGDQKIVLAALREEQCFTLADADESLQCDRSFVLQAVKCNGRQLKYAKGDFQTDRHITSVAARCCSMMRPALNRQLDWRDNHEACRKRHRVWSKQVGRICV